MSLVDRSGQKALEVVSLRGTATFLNSYIACINKYSCSRVIAMNREDILY